MAIPSTELINTLRQTADRLETGVEYYWSHQGNCNCGHLVQTVTKLKHSDIHAMALEKAGDWAEKVMDYCPTSNYSIDGVIRVMLDLGFTTEDLYHLERLSSPRVNEFIRREHKPLKHNCRKDVILYMRVWADMLEAQMEADRMMIENSVPVIA